MHFLFNMETITAFNHRDSMLEMSKGKLSGVVFGRVDFSGSLGLGRAGVESSEVTSKIEELAGDCKTANLELVIGGGISSDALPVVKSIQEIKLTRFETRKVVFSGESAVAPNIQDGLLNAVHFELLWLINKRDYYANITQEDQSRIEMLESRWKILGREVL
jgi:hypothetical protein